jgi:hypothetical protein
MPANNASPEAWIYATAAAAGIDIYPVTSPDKKEPPFCCFARDNTDRDLDLENGTTGAVLGTFTVEIYSDGYLAGKALADSVRAALNNFTGTANGATIDRVQLTDERDGSPVEFEGRSQTTFVIEQIYQISWNE